MEGPRSQQSPEIVHQIFFGSTYVLFPGRRFYVYQETWCVSLNFCLVVFRNVIKNYKLSNRFQLVTLTSGV